MKQFFVILLSVLPCVAFAQKSNLKKYLKGAISEKEGIVVFERDFDVKGNKSNVYTKMLDFAKQLVKESDNDDYSKITMDNPEKGIVVANVQELMYFKKSSWNSDGTEFFYRILMTIEGQKVNVKVQDIRYNYENDYGLRAEKWITDKYALSKDGKSLRKDTGKFRRFTIDRIEQIWLLIQTTLK